MSLRVVGVSLENAAAFKRELAAMAEEARTEAVEDAARAMSLPVLPAVTERAPVLKAPDPRRLAGNLKSKIKAWQGAAAPGKVTWYVGLSSADMRVGLLAVFYARWVEWGRKGMDAIPFLRPGLDATADTAAARGIDAFRRFLAGWGAR